MTCHRCAHHAGVAIQRVRHGRVEVVCEGCAGLPACRPLAPDVIRRGTVSGQRATLRDVGGELVLFGGEHGEFQSVVVTPASRGAGVATLGLWFDESGAK